MKRLRLCFVFAGLTLFSGWTSAARPLDNDELFAAMVTLVVGHDVAIFAGVLPFPAIQYSAETVEYGSNIALKYLRPWLEAPASIEVFPDQSRTYANDGYTSDGCGIQFELLSPEAEYENLFGFANIPEAYYDARTNTTYPWFPGKLGKLSTRWGLLGSPTVYHANSSVVLRLGTPNPVRRYDFAADALGELYEPIDPGAEDPQFVYLPIGRHTVAWEAATELNRISDVIAPGALLLTGLLTEVKNAYAGAKYAREARDVGISKAIINQPLDPQGAARLSEGVRRYEDIWKTAWKKKRRSKLLRQLRENIECTIRGTMFDVLGTAASAGVSTLSEGVADELREAGLLTRAQAELLDTIYTTWRDNNRDLAVIVIQAGLDCDDKDETVVALVELVIQDLIEFDLLQKLGTRETAYSTVGQTITVWDNVPPTITLPPEPVVIEATDFGGTRLFRARDQLQPIAEAGARDNCGRRPELILDAPELLTLGTNNVTWTARDKGPNPPDDGQDYAPTATQTVIVADRQPPIILAPPGKVVESAAPLSLADAEVGEPAVVDLVDVAPVVANDAPAVFPVNRRTRIAWTATDGSGNEASATQQVTIKTPGTNTAPVIPVAPAAQTLTAEPVNIRLEARDDDVLDGVADPLWFRIASQPSHGQFIAPLFPFFIEDYRTRPGDGLGPEFDPTQEDARSFIRRNYCSTDLADKDRVPPRNFVHEARFVHVTDDGERYVLDEFFTCPQFDDNPQTFARFSKWAASGDFLGQARIGSEGEDEPLDDSFVVDRDGFLYFYQASQPGSSSNQLRLRRCKTDWENRSATDTTAECGDSYTFDGNSAPDSAIDAGSLALARIDSDRDIAYVADRFSVFAFALSGDRNTRYLGELGPLADEQLVANWVGRPQALEVGSDGSVYVADVAHHRIHKIGPVTVDTAGEPVPGDYVGWAGRCTGSGNNACRDGRSRGYSCTFEPDSCTVAPANRAGSAQGQFNTPRFIAIDPRDVLYVADYENARIQRLGPDGSFAGEAVSKGTGINAGNEPSFIIGNLGKPASVSVNSSQFFVVDRDEQFVHVFGTLPFKDITDNAATLEYVSDQDFPNPNVSGTDTFSFTATDGLATSDPAIVTVTVNRNFRPPVALADTVTTLEDVAVALELPAEDPDGIAGKDFLGLDTLTYTITKQPEHGTLTEILQPEANCELPGDGACWRYTPEAEFFGDDQLSFRANDGRDDSEEAVVTLTVIPANDPPVVTINPPDQMPLGFPVLLDVEFTDDPGDSYEARIVWGDGKTDVTGGIETPEGGDPVLNGIQIAYPPPSGGAGRLVAEHTFEAGGPRTVTACATDSEGLEGCDSIVVDVQPLVSLGISGLVYAEQLAEDEISLQEVADGESFSYEVTVHNGLPSVGAGLPAEGVVLAAALPAALSITDISVSQGQCTTAELVLNCKLGDLEPGAAAVLTIGAAGPGRLQDVQARDLNGTVWLGSGAAEAETEFMVTVDLVPNTADSDGDGMSDGFELAYGLDPGRDDAGEDADADGLTNLQEYELGTSPRNTDSDGDSMADGWEVANGFDPVSPADADEDADGDGSSNHEEHAKGTEPRNPDTDGDGVPDGPDNCPLAANAGQEDVDGDGLGDACDNAAGDRRHLLLRRASDSRWTQYTLVGSSVASAGLLDLTRSFDYQPVSRGDFDGDGYSDLLVRDVTGNKGGRWALWTLVDQRITSAGAPKLTPNLDYAVISTDDFSGDGKADVLTRSATTGRWAMFLMNGKQVTGARELTGLPRDLSLQPVATADFDGDGRSDLLLRRADGTWSMHLLDGLTVVDSGVPTFTTADYFRVQAVADFNGDGRGDVLLRRPNGNWFMYLMDGLRIVDLGKPPITKNTAWQIAAADDFDGDGRSDVLIRNRDDERWSMSLMNGRRIRSAGLVNLARNRQLQVLETGDFNGDGRADVLLRHVSDEYQSIRWVLHTLDGLTVLETAQPEVTRNPDWKPVTD